MSDPRNIARRLEQTQVIERPGGVSGHDAFYEPITTYTPTYVGGTTAGVTTYTLQQGSYVRIGSVVFFTCTVVWSAATGTGNARISLPFNASSTANQNYSLSLRNDGVTFANGTPQGQIGANTQFFIMISPITNAGGTTVAVEAAGTVIASGFYFID